MSGIGIRDTSGTSAASAVPAALAGSIALLLGAQPAAAIEQVQVPETHTVQRGDTVFGIAMRFGLRTTDVLALNGLTPASIIVPDQVLRLTGVVDPAPAVPAAPAAAPVAASGTYAVQAGDTLSAIAAGHGITVEALFSANGLGWASIIYPGQTLAIPGAASTAPATPSAPAVPAPPPPAPVAASGTYTVQAGDTLSLIAARHGLTVQALFSANGLGWASVIYPGQTIAIPGAVTAAPPAPAAPAPTAPAEPVQNPIAVLDADQTANAQLVIRIGRELGVPDRGIAIALAAAMQESSLRNLSGGDRDSLGLFQQRPSAGWGTEAEALDPVRATRAFFGGPSDPNGALTRGLLDIPGWQDLSFTQAAQAVQISAYPDSYAGWELSATTWLATFG